MHAEAQSFAQIVKEPKHIVVPFFQRGYVWNRDNWDELIDELSTSDSNHFLGSVIFKSHNNRMGQNYWSVIDGQQRLTTLSILFNVCCMILLSDPSSDKNLRSYIEQQRNLILFVSTPKGTEIKLQHSRADRDAYAEAISLSENNMVSNVDPSKIREKKTLVQCREFFLGELSGQLEKTRKIFDLLQGWDAKILVNIQLENQDNEQAIFDAINSSGVRLTAADTIKNAIFQRMMEIVDSNHHKDVETLHDEYWEKVFYRDDQTNRYWSKQISQGRVNRITLEILLHCVAMIEGFYDPNKHSVGELSECYKEYVKGKTFLELSEFVKKVANYAQTYRRFFRDEDQYENGYEYDNVCARTLHILRFCDTSTFDPLILKLVAENSTGDDGSVSDSVKDTLDGIAKYVLRHVVCHASTKNFNKECALIISGERTIESYIAERVCSTDAKSRIADDEVRKGLRNVRHNRIARGILFWLELKRRYEMPCDIKHLSDANMELEHLMPQKWTEFWPITSPKTVDPETGAEITDPILAESLRRDSVYEIGNMALLNKKLNASIRNHSIKEKLKGNGGKHPGIEQLADMKYTIDVVKEVQENGYVWNEKTIRDRTDVLTNGFLAIWGVGNVS